ncbi:MAG: CHASE domain-containing protein [Bacteroidetes bacterium]|nr:CHASE domain-containing protein [Bacteroidota bacterium]
MMIKNSIKQSMPFLIAVLSFTILVMSAISYTEFKKDSWEKDVKTRLFEILMTKKTMLEKALYSRIHYTRSVAAYVSLKPNISTLEYYNLAHELIDNDSVICTMSLSKDCIIGAVYPLEGHEAAIGLNLLAHPERFEIVQKTIETHESFIAGPVELMEGGLAFISYTPIFDKTIDKNGKFWGVTDIVVYQNQLLEQAGLIDRESGFLFALRGYNGLGNKGAIWWGDDKVFSQNPVTVNIDIPNGSWVLAAVPEIGWTSYLNQDQVLLSLLIVSSFIISILIWLLSRGLVKIKRNEQELSAIFKSMDSLIIEFDHEGRYIKIPPVNPKLLYKTEAELINKTVYEIFPYDYAKLFHNAILECLNSKKIIELEYPLNIDGKEIWFSAKFSRKSEQRVIMHAFDNTEKKNAMEATLRSEQRLKELNATKDKFFSIIAHDLKSPFNVILGYSDLLSTEYEYHIEDQRRKIIEELNNASKSAYSLLENLLLWAKSQNDKFKIVKENLNLLNLINESIDIYIPLARNKQISYHVEVNDKITVYADKFALTSVISNLFNNAIKFTPKNGNIIIEAIVKAETIEISIADNGIGIPHEIIPKLFRIEEGISTSGTNNEKGTGLGLILCKEFIEKHDGNICVESSLKGSTFYFSLPNDKVSEL